jgi:protein-tyrosine-phosphatase
MDVGLDVGDGPAEATGIGGRRDQRSRRYDVQQASPECRVSKRADLNCRTKEFQRVDERDDVFIVRRLGWTVSRRRVARLMRSAGLRAKAVRGYRATVGAHRFYGQLVTAEVLHTSDLIVVMSADQATDLRWRGAPLHVPVIVLGDLDSEPIETRTIRDPWNCDDQVFRDSYARIERCVRELAAAIVNG